MNTIYSAPIKCNPSIYRLIRDVKPFYLHFLYFSACRVCTDKLTLPGPHRLHSPRFDRPFMQTGVMAHSMSLRECLPGKRMFRQKKDRMEHRHGVTPPHAAVALPCDLRKSCRFVRLLSFYPWNYGEGRTIIIDEISALPNQHYYKGV